MLGPKGHVDNYSLAIAFMCLFAILLRALAKKPKYKKYEPLFKPRVWQFTRDASDYIVKIDAI
jgi:hypothetical protein